MIGILLALIAVAPTRPDPWAEELLCWDSGYCQPRVVNLGEWDPRPLDWDVTPFVKRADEP